MANSSYTMTGFGEEKEDIWRKYFLAGKIQSVNERIVFDDFDEEKLELTNITQNT